MSRSGYGEGDWGSEWESIRWRGAVASATRGKRGQAMLRELLAALDALPEKRLISHELIEKGEVCAIGSLGVKRQVDLARIDPDDYDAVARAFQVAPALVREIEYENDECGSYPETPEQRWVRMRAWVASQIKEEPVSGT